MKRGLWVLAGILPMLASCQSQQSGSVANLPEIGISHAVLSYYGQYRDRINPLVFAVSEDGRWASYISCDGHKCQNGSQATSSEASQAVALCNEAAAVHGSCSVFAVGLGAPRKYHMID